MFITRYLWSKLSISSGFQSFSTFVLLAAAVWLAHPAMASADEAAREIEIVALGDSLTAGYGLSPRDGFVPQLQAACANAAIMCGFSMPVSQAIPAPAGAPALSGQCRQVPMR